MGNFDIVNFITENLSTNQSAVLGVAGSVISAIFLRRKNKIETSTQEFEKIKACHFKDVAEQLLTAGILSYTEYYKMNNYADIARKADAEFKKRGENQNNHNEIPLLPKQNFDWHVRFFELCGNISDEEMQTLWARILAGEIERPGAYSLRTIDCLKSLSQEEAALFLKICRCSIAVGKNVIIPKERAYLEDKNITYDDILRLSDCGLMKSDSILSTAFENVEGKYSIITCSNKYGLFYIKRPDVKNGSKGLSIDDYIFTQSGKELYSVIIDSDERDFDDLCKIYNETYKDFQFVIVPVSSKTEKGIKFQSSDQ